MKLNLNRGLVIPFFLVHSSITFRNFSEHFSLKKCVEERGEEQRGQVIEIDLLKDKRLGKLPGKGRELAAKGTSSDYFGCSSSLNPPFCYTLYQIKL